VWHPSANSQLALLFFVRAHESRDRKLKMKNALATQKVENYCNKTTNYYIEKQNKCSAFYIYVAVANKEM
jgi:hypothetical protein